MASTSVGDRLANLNIGVTPQDGAGWRSAGYTCRVAQFTVIVLAGAAVLIGVAALAVLWQVLGPNARSRH